MTIKRPTFHSSPRLAGARRMVFSKPGINGIGILRNCDEGSTKRLSTAVRQLVNFSTCLMNNPSALTTAAIIKNCLDAASNGISARNGRRWYLTQEHYEPKHQASSLY